MNEETRTLLYDVVERLQRSIVAGDWPAIVVLDGRPRLALSDYDYLLDPQAAAAFEQGAAARARQTGATRWVLAVPHIWSVTRPGVVSGRPPWTGPPGDDEAEVITWLTFDLADGIDYGFVRYTRRPNGDPVFGEPEMLLIDLEAAEKAPGRTLLRAYLDDADSTP